MPKRYPVAKELQKEFKAALEQGCKVEDRTNHLFLVTPKGHRVPIHRGSRLHKDQRRFFRSNLRRVGIKV
jgi:hypothetical protein